MHADRELGGAANHLSEIVWSVEPDGTVSFTNRSWQNISCRDEQVAEQRFPFGFPSPDILHTEDREKLLALWEKHTKTVTSFAAEVRFYKSSDRSFAWYMLSMSPVVDQNNQLAFWQAIISKIDGLKGVQSLFQLVMDNIPISIFWKDRTSTYLGCNKSFLGDVGLSDPSELIGKTDYDNPTTKEQSDFFVACDKKVMESGTPEYHIIEPQHRPDGHKAWLDTSKVPLRDAGGEVFGVLGMYEDITKRISLENQREEFVAALTHDLKNPILGANRILDVLIEAGDKETGVPKSELLEMIRASNLSLLILIQNMLEVYRYECDDSERRSEIFSISKLVDLCAIEAMEEARSKHIAVSVNICQQNLEMVGNKQEIIRVLQNLLENALKFTRPRGHIVVNLQHGDGKCVLEVQDDGVGIDPDEQKNLFSRFWQGKKGKTICNSTGLGLYICKKIVESHGGTISAESELNKGSTFRVTLPAHKVRTAPRKVAM